VWAARCVPTGRRWVLAQPRRGTAAVSERSVTCSDRLEATMRPRCASRAAPRRQAASCENATSVLSLFLFMWGFLWERTV